MFYSWVKAFPFFSIFVFDTYTLQNESRPGDLSNLYADSEKSSTSLLIQRGVGYLSREIRNTTGLILAQAVLCHTHLRVFEDGIHIHSVSPLFLKSFEQISNCYFVVMVDD